MTVTLEKIRFYRPPSLPARPAKNICHPNRHTPFPPHALVYPSPSHSDSPPASPSQPSLHCPLPPRPPVNIPSSKPLWPVNTPPPLNTCNTVGSEPTILGDFDEEIQDFLYEPAGTPRAEIIPIDPAILDSETACENACLRMASTTRKTGGDEQASPRSSPDPLLSEPSFTHELCLETSNHESGREVVTSQSPGSYLDHDRIGDQYTRSSASLTTNLVTDPDEVQGTGESGKMLSARKRRSRTRQDTELDFGRAAKQPRSTSALNENVDSLSALRSHFLTTPLEGRLEFLSWLFEGAFSQCMSDPDLALSPSSISMTQRIPKGGRSPFKSRENKPWKSEEIDLLVQLRKEEQLPWSDVGKRLAEKFPGRTVGAIQVYWSTKLKDRTRSRKLAEATI